MKKLLSLFPLNLTLHDGAAAAAPGAAPAGQAPDGTPAPGVVNRGKPGEAQPKVVYGKQPEAAPPAAGEQKPAAQPAAPAEKTPEARKAEFQKLIAGEFKEEFAEHFQQTFDRRFKGVKTTEEQLKAVSPIIDTLGEKYGVTDKDPAKILAAFENDNAMFEELAEAAGLSVEQYKNSLKLQRENAALRAQNNQRDIQEQNARRNAELHQQAEALKATYPDFDLAAEIVADDNFAKMLNAGVPVKTAFEAIHFNDIMSGAIQEAGKRTAQNVAATIQAKGQRPIEAGAVSTPGVIVKSDPSKFTKADRDEIVRRAARGEPISL